MGYDKFLSKKEKFDNSIRDVRTEVNNIITEIKNLYYKFETSGDNCIKQVFDELAVSFDQV